jgi:L-threonylcarbamoyladenylate synthase
MPFPPDRPAGDPELSFDGLVTTDVGFAVQRLRSGGLAAIPTETVYGLAADAERADAVARIFEVKGRPANHPLIVHLAAPESIHDGWIDPSTDPHVVRAVDRLANTCWPGPLTMLVPRGARAIDAVTGGRSTVGIRVPAHPDAQRILSVFEGGLAMPSANRYGRVSPTTAQHVIADLGALLDPRRDTVFDGGRSAVGVESTIVDLASWPPQVLRAGAIDAAAVASVLMVELDEAGGPSRASGMLSGHYAPECPMVLAETAAGARRIGDEHSTLGRKVRVLDRTDDLVQAAFELYNDLRAADNDGIEVLVVVLPPAEGVGHAIRDRLFKAAAGSGRQPSPGD